MWYCKHGHTQKFLENFESVTMEFCLVVCLLACLLLTKLGPFSSQNYRTSNKTKHQLRSKRDFILDQEWETQEIDLKVSFS